MKRIFNKNNKLRHCYCGTPGFTIPKPTQCDTKIKIKKHHKGRICLSVRHRRCDLKSFRIGRKISLLKIKAWQFNDYFKLS